MYYIGKFIFWLYFHLLYRLKIDGLENVPKTGAIIICSNHISVLDPMVLGAIIKRPIRFMGKKELFSNAFFSWVLKKIGVFPVDRSITDLNAYKTVISHLKNNQVIGIFIQGKRVSSEDNISAKSGAALFALKSKVPIVPIGISSSYAIFGKININIGNAVFFDEYYSRRINNELLTEVTESVVSNLNLLIKR